MGDTGIILQCSDGTVLTRAAQTSADDGMALSLLDGSFPR